MTYRPAYERANRLAALFCRMTRLPRQHPTAHDVWACVWYRAAGIAFADRFKP